MKFFSPNTSSINALTRCKFSSLICTNTEPLSVNKSRATVNLSRRYVRYEWIPSRHVSRNALTCSGSRVMWSALPSLTSRLVVDHWKLELNLMP